MVGRTWVGWQRWRRRARSLTQLELELGIIVNHVHDVLSTTVVLPTPTHGGMRQKDLAVLTVEPRHAGGEGKEKRRWRVGIFINKVTPMDADGASCSPRRRDAEIQLFRRELKDLEEREDRYCTSHQPLSHQDACLATTAHEITELEERLDELRVAYLVAERTYQACAAALSTALAVADSECSARRVADDGLVDGQGTQLPADESELKRAVATLEHLLDANIGAPRPDFPFDLCPDSMCSALVESSMRSLLSAADREGRSPPSRGVGRRLEVVMLISRAVRALGRRGDAHVAALQEASALNQILRTELQAADEPQPGPGDMPSPMVAALGG